MSVLTRKPHAAIEFTARSFRPVGSRLYLWLSRLESRNARYALVAISGLLLLPCVCSGWALDDFILLSQFRPDNEWGGSAPFDLFRWLDLSSTPRVIDGAGLAWWTYPQTVFALMRPVSSLTHVLDEALWPHSALAMHLHSVAWFALLCWCTARWYAEVIEEPWVRSVASALFVLDGAHGMCVGWICNRNALISAVFAVLTLLCHQRARTSRSSWATLAGPLCCALCLFSGELGLGVFGYLFAYTWFMERGGIAQRSRALLPYAAIFVLWAGVRLANGYGVHGVGGYVDPLYEPLTFLELAPAQYLVLLTSQLTRLSADAYAALPGSAQSVWLVVAAVFSIAVGRFVWPVLRAQAALRMCALGACVSLLPLLAAGQASDRLLVLAGVGVLPVLASALYEVLHEPGLRHKPQRGMARMLVFAHFIVSPCTLLGLSLVPAMITQVTAAVDRSLPEDASLQAETVLLTNVPESVYVGYLRARRAVEGRIRPAKLYWLQATTSASWIERRAERELTLSCDDGCFDARWNDRSSRLPLKVGDRVELSAFTLRVDAVTPDGRPTRCSLQFAKPLEADGFRWLTWRHGQLTPWVIPRIGERVALSPS